MAEYLINKGVGRQVEIQGLSAQYLFIFVAGLGGVFLLFVTLSTPERLRHTSASAVLCRNFIVPAPARDAATVGHFLDAVKQLERILNDSGLLTLERLTAAEIVGTKERAGVLPRYFALSDTRQSIVNEDIRLDPDGVRIGNKHLAVYTLSDLDVLPQSVATDARYERFSTERSDSRLSFAAPAGLLLPCSHIYNQLLFLDNHDETLKRLEATARNMNSLANYSRSNAINKEWIDLYLNEAHSQGLRSVRCHCNVVTWAEDDAELKKQCNDVGAQLASMGCTPRHNTVDVPVLFWSCIPGAEGDFPAEETFPTFLDRRYTSSTRKHPAAPPSRRSASGWPTGCRVFRCIWTSATCR